MIIVETGREERVATGVAYKVTAPWFSDLLRFACGVYSAGRVSKARSPSRGPVGMW